MKILFINFCNFFLNFLNDFDFVIGVCQFGDKFLFFERFLILVFHPKIQPVFAGF